MCVLSETIIKDVCLDQMKYAKEQINSKCSIVDWVKLGCGLLDVGLSIVDQAPMC